MSVQVPCAMRPRSCPVRPPANKKRGRPDHPSVQGRSISTLRLNVIQTIRCLPTCTLTNSHVSSTLRSSFHLYIGASTSTCYVTKLTSEPRRARASFPRLAHPTACKHTIALESQEHVSPPLTALKHSLATLPSSREAISDTHHPSARARNFHNDGRSMVVPTGGVDKRRQPVSSSLLHDHVQRFGMVSEPVPSERSWRELRRMRLEASIFQGTR